MAQEARSKRSFDWRTSKTTREVRNARSRHCITRTQELAKWQETYATKDPETPEHGNEKEETKETVKLLAGGEKKNRRNRQTVILVIKNSQTSTMWLLQIKQSITGTDGSVQRLKE
jgi:hypothetical protein